MKQKLCTSFLFLLFYLSAAHAAIRYVKVNGTGDGSSWANAGNDLQLMINQSNAGDEIRVAGGMYSPIRPDTNTAVVTLNNRRNAFVLKSGVAIYGGYFGSGIFSNLRAPQLYTTILDGDIGTLNDNSDNTYHLVLMLGGSDMVLDGFAIQNANANGSPNAMPVNGFQVGDNGGAAVFAQLSTNFNISSCKITNNAGTGYTTLFQGSSGTLTHTDILNNDNISGGHITIGNASNSLSNYVYSDVSFQFCHIAGNTSEFGTITITGGSTARFYNCAVTGNSVTLNYGTSINNGLFSTHGNSIYGFPHTELVNCIFSGNKYDPSHIKSIYTDTVSYFSFVNSIMWGDAEITNPILAFGNGTFDVKHSITQGQAWIFNSLVEGANIDADPQFVNASAYTTAPFINGDYHIEYCSPAINTGNNSYLSSTQTTDMDNKPRISGGIVDMGIYETPVAMPDANGIVYVNTNAASGGDGSSWGNAINEVADALKAAKANNSIQQIWVVAGTYKPLYTADSMLCNSYDTRKNSFLLRSNLKLLGGFAGTETDVSQRNPAANITTLSGDIGIPEINQDNAYHLIIMENVSGVVVDGFTLKDANANASGNMMGNFNTVPHNAGAAIIMKVAGSSLAKNIISHCRIANNNATYGAVWSDNSSDNVFDNIVFESNTGDSAAALQIQYSGNIEVRNCRFSGNTSYGGIVNLFGMNGDLKFHNDIFNGNKINNNTYPGYYPGTFNNNTDTFSTANQKGTEIVNCTFSGNTFTSLNNALVIAKNKGKLAVKNCAFSANLGAYTEPSATCTYNNCISGWGFVNAAGSANNITADAGFVNAPSYAAAPFTNGDYHLTRCSQAINTGNDSFLTVNDTTDFAGNKRKIAGRIDIGAYEYQMGTPDANGVVYVDSSKAPGGNGSSWASAITEVADALKAAKYDTCIHQIWIAKGTYKPLYTADSMLCNTYDSRKKSFVIPDGLAVYGGFAGTETVPSLAWIDEPWNMVHETILSGDIGAPNVDTDNVYHVVISSNNNVQSLLAGVTIEKGYGNNPTVSGMVVNGLSINSYTGAGMINRGDYPNNPVNTGCSLIKCRFRNNNSFYGALAYLSCVYSNVSFTEITNNTGVFGGGITNLDTGYLVVQECALRGNTATTQGGGMYNSSKAKAYIASTLIAGNYTPGPGGGIGNSDADLILANCTIAANKASGDFGGIDHANTLGIKKLIIKNSILYDNSAANNYDMDLTNNPLIVVSNSTIGSGYNYGTNSVNAAPMFVSPSLPANAPTVSGDYHLGICSPAINAGDTANISVDDADLDLLPRITQNKMNLGVYQGAGFMLTQTPGDSIASVISSVYDFSFGCNPIYYLPYSLWNNIATSTKKLILSVNQPTGNLSSVLPITFSDKLRPQYGSGSTLQLSNPFGQSGYYYPMNRSWSVVTTGNITSPVSVRFYFDATDSADIAAQSNFGSLQNLVVYKVGGTDAYNPNATGYKEYTYAATADTTHFSLGTYQGIRYVEFLVTGFSSGSIALKSFTPLSIALGDITATNVDTRNRIDWKTYNEAQSDNMILQHSNDGKDFFDMAGIATRGVPSSYTYWDEQPFGGMNYYRLKMLDKSNNITYSKIVTALVNSRNAFAMLAFPNPAKNVLHLNIVGDIKSNAQIIITNVEGKQIASLTVSGAQQNIDLSSLADGIYIIKYSDAQHQQILKISKQ